MMEDNSNISQKLKLQWYPGHMTKTKRQMLEDISSVDIVAEIVDARIPNSSRNPDLDKLASDSGKPRIILLNKSDMADETANREWMEYYKSLGHEALMVDCQSGKGVKDFIPAVNKALAEKIERKKAKGMVTVAIKIMVAGIPNVGKSSFINRLCGGRRTKVEDRPGVTRGKQLVSTGNGIDLLDTPGILWPKFDDETVAKNLAFTGAIKDDITDIELVAILLLEELAKLRPEVLRDRYGMDETDGLNGYELMDLLCKKRGFIIKGGEDDIARGSKLILTEFRGVKLGRITLERINKKSDE